MNSQNLKFDCIVVGAGHAGIEASIASSRLGLKTLLTTIFYIESKMKTMDDISIYI